MSQRLSEQRHQANIESVRALVDAGSPDLVRDPVVGSMLGSKRRKYPLPVIGHRQGKLTVTGYIRSPRGGVKALVVRCDCSPDEYPVDRGNFKRFRSTRCPMCARKAGARKRYWKYIEVMPDDEHRTRLLNRLAAAIGRCHSPTNRAYHHYGGRGISVHEEWRKDRAAFLRYVQTLEGWDNPEFDMDRIDTNGSYEPGNIRFVSRSDNARNKRRVADLEAEIARLRSRLRRAEAQIHGADGLGAADRP